MDVDGDPGAVNDLSSLPVASIDAERKFPRRDAALTLLLPDGWKAEVLDISISGMKIRSVAFLARNQTLDGKLLMPDGREVALKIHVIWSTPPDPGGLVLAEAGLEVLEVTDDFKRALVEIFAKEA